MNTTAILSEELSRAVGQAAACIRNGGVVAFPTETYYGLAVDPFNAAALRRLFALKKRPAQKPILILIDHLQQLNFLAADVPEAYLPLMERFWPGPLTLIFPAHATLSSHLTGGTDTIGVRISSNPLAVELSKVCRMPITATSANLSGVVPAVCPDEVRRQFGSSLDMIIEGGGTPGGNGSTVVGISENQLSVFRPGVIPEAAIRQIDS